MVRRRSLRPDEEDLWQTVARTAQPLHPKPGRPRTLDLPKALTSERPHPVETVLPTFRIGEKARDKAAHALLPNLSPRPAAPPLRMDAKAFGRMSRGKLAPEARIDLHGMTLAEAHPELVAFILSAAAQGRRLVLVITGKGRAGEDGGPIPQRPGILRHQVPRWLSQPPLSAVVLQVAEAHLKHGGGGALYVYLRRGR